MNYEKHAELFAKANGIELTINSYEFKKHFNEDDSERYVFNCTLKHDNRKFTFNFGQSIANSCKTVTKKITETVDSIDVFAGLFFAPTRITVSVKFKLLKENDFCVSSDEVEVLAKKMQSELLEREREYYKTKYDVKPYDISNFIACINRAIKKETDKTVNVYVKSDEITFPTMYDILSGLQKYDIGTFNDFCSVFGYDNDSIKVHKIYKAVSKEYKNMLRVFGYDLLEKMQEIQ